MQELSFRIPYRNTEGKRQYILFPGIGDVKAGVESVTLRATSDCGLPVYYYVKEALRKSTETNLYLLRYLLAVNIREGDSSCLAIWAGGKGTDSRADRTKFLYLSIIWNKTKAYGTINQN